MGAGEEQEDTPLHEAVRYSDQEDTLEALRAGHDPNQIGLYQWSALHEAAHIGDLSILSLLLKHGGDPNKADLLRSCTALHYAASQGHVDCLQALLDVGAKWDALDRDGNTSLDVATGDCIFVLRKLNNNNVPTDNTVSKGRAGDAHLISDNCSRETLEKAVLSDTQPTAKTDSDIETIKSTETSSECTLDPDEVSLASLDSLGSSLTPSSSSSWSPQAWKTDGPVVGIGRRLILGQIQLSFEYNSKKATFKIRVWQLTDLLLPPVETSMISGIYVKSYLMPDKRKDSKRKTEELPVYKPDDKLKKHDMASRSVILKPSSFQFSKSPEYKKVTPSMVEERMVHIEVCVLQKYTRRSFVLATWNMPMKEAVKKLVKHSYPLTPRISTELPENMKVYDGSQLTVTSSSRPYSSSPNTRVPSISSLQRIRSEATDRAASDTDLKNIKVEVDDVKKSSSIEITVPDEDADDLEHALQQITIMERAERDRWTSVPVSMPGMSDDFDSRSDSSSNRRTVVCDVHDVAVHVPPGRDKVQSQSYTNQAFECSSADGPSIVDTIQTKKKRKFSLRNLRDRQHSEGSKKDKAKQSSRLSVSKEDQPRPESPTWQWDNYMEPLQTAMEPVTFDDDFGFELDMPYLPMTTTLDMPRIHGNSFSKDNNDSDVPLIATTSFSKPDIVVIPPDKSPVTDPKKGSPPAIEPKIAASCDTSVSMPEDVKFHIEDDALKPLAVKKGKVRAKPGSKSTAIIPERTPEELNVNTEIDNETTIELSSYNTNSIFKSELNCISNEQFSHDDLDDVETIMI